MSTLAPYKTIVRILVFTAVAFVIMVAAHIISMRQHGAAWGQVMQVHHIRHLTISRPYDEAFALCIQSIEPIPKSQVTHIDRDNGRIEVSVGLTWRTLGDTIIFTLAAVDERTTAVAVSSRPAVRPTRFDYGKNLENIHMIERMLAAADRNEQGKPP